MAERDLDVVVFGASSVTGRQTAVYLADRAKVTGAGWAVAGRDPEKLAAVMAEVGVTPPESLVADVADRGSLVAMAKRARVILNLVGPYTLYGEPVIAACAAGGTHYVDLTGEIPFARRMLSIYHAPAAETGAKIVQVCGFEALPPDMLVRLAAEAARERHGEPLSEVDLSVFAQQPRGRPRASDLVSGGTMQSLAAAAGDPDAIAATDPGCLVTDPEQADAVRERSPIKLAPRRDTGGNVIAPMTPAAFINPAVIHRSAALAAADAGEPFTPFRYLEGTAIAGHAVTLPLRYTAAAALSGMQAGNRAIMRSRPGVRRRASKALGRILPGSGFGPAPDRLEDWRWTIRVEARTGGGDVVRATVEADGHPGYLATSRMMGEAGLALAEDGSTPDRAGCLTPAMALGTAGAGRFAHAAVRFSVDPE